MLCAYYTGPAGLSAAELRDYLAPQLPAYMIRPILSAWSGCRDGERETGHQGSAQSKELVSYRQGICCAAGRHREYMVRIWAEVLSIREDKVGVQDTFFDLAGTRSNSCRWSTS